MFKNFDDIITAACAKTPKRTIVIANAADSKMIHVVQSVLELNLCNVICVGNQKEILRLAKDAQLSTDDFSIIDETDEIEAALKAVTLVSSHQADVLVKGYMNTSDFLRSVLNKEVGLRTGRQLNVLTCYDEPNEKLFFMTDGGMTIAPTLEDKVEILQNAVPVLHNMGITNPKIAILAANEKVSPKMPATVDARALCDMAAAGDLPKAIYEGPVAFDVAMNPKAAKEKNIDSKITGDVDLFLVPNIETGNCMGKAIGYFAGGQTAGIVIGASAPVVMSSRAAGLKGKVTSIAWAILACG